jgi:hypothetical protein
MQGRADPDDATAPERALSAIALARYASTGAPNAAEARRVAREIVDELVPNVLMLGNEPAPALTLAPNAAGLTIEAIRLLNDPDMTARRHRVARLTERVRLGLDNGAWSRAAPLPTRASVVLGLAAASELAKTDAPDQAAALYEEASRALALIYTSTPPGVLVTHCPWLLTAELLMLSASDGTQLPEILAAPALREVRDQINRHTMTLADVGDEPDLAGGIVFTQGRASLPTWFGARALAGNAIMLGEPRLTSSEERLKELSHLLEGLRFLRQLTVDEDWMWGVTSPEEVRWGVRISLWDQRQPIDASAMTLLAVVETMESLKRANAK